MKLPTPEKILATPIGELAALPSDSLFQIKNDAIDLLSAAKAIADQIDRALDLKYADRTLALRTEAGKDTGIVHFNDGAVRITADLPKKIEWDQTKLAAVVSRIAAAGDNPAQYVDISYRVSETKYGAWPEGLREQFTGARTLKTGKPGYRLALIDVEGAQ